MKLLSETKLSFPQLAREEGVNPATVWRWASRGVRGVQLEHYCRGGRRFTTREAFARFCVATTAAADGPTPTRTSEAREKSMRAAEAELAKVGI
jgi:hypothetical protein